MLLSQTRYTMLLNMSRGPHLDAYSIDGFRNKVIVTTQKNRDIGASPSSLPTFSHMLSIKLLSPPPLRVPPNAALRGGVRAQNLPLALCSAVPHGRPRTARVQRRVRSNLHLHRHVLQRTLALSLLLPLFVLTDRRSLLDCQ